MAVRADLSVRKGNSFQARFDMQTSAGVARDVSGSGFVFRAIGPTGELIRKATPDSAWSIPTPANGQIFLTLTVAETRALPAAGTPIRYEVEERLANGVQITRLFGALIVTEWANDDA